MTVQATNGQLLVDVLTKLQVLHADLVSVQRSLPPPPFNDKPGLPFGNLSQKGGVHIEGDKGEILLFGALEL